jgi:hypothetical protein
VALGKLYVLAEMLMDDTTKDTVHTAILTRLKEPFADGLRCYPGLDAVNIIYGGTTQGNPARRLLIDLYTDFIGAGFDSAAHFTER